VKHVLAPAQRPLLERFAWSRVLIALDFDGTLAPIRLDPATVALGPRTRQLLGEVAGLYPTAVISGRARKDVAARLGGLPLYAVIGNHGMEPAGNSSGKPGTVHRTEVARWIVRLHRDLDGHPGIEIENKGLSVAIHYRRCRNQQQALAAITASVARLGPLRPLGGKCVLNVLPRGAVHKGDALLGLVARAGCEKAIYVGDDDTDEDVFSLETKPPGVLLGIRVGKNRTSHAGYYLRERGEVEILLRALRDARAGRRS
jgi:trehalose 6-phosphate phosphatase